MTSAIERFSDHVATASFERMSAEERIATKTFLLDTIGVESLTARCTPDPMLSKMSGLTDV